VRGSLSKERQTFETTVTTNNYKLVVRSITCTTNTADFGRRLVFTATAWFMITVTIASFGDDRDLDKLYNRESVLGNIRKAFIVISTTWHPIAS
jgi:hypothetical protein